MQNKPCQSTGSEKKHEKAINTTGEAPKPTERPGRSRLLLNLVGELGRDRAPLLEVTNYETCSPPLMPLRCRVLPTREPRTVSSPSSLTSRVTRAARSAAVLRGGGCGG